MTQVAHFATSLVLLHNLRHHWRDIRHGKLMMREIPVLVISVRVKRGMAPRVHRTAIVSQPNIEAFLKQTHWQSRFGLIREMEPWGRVGQKSVLQQQGAFATLAWNRVTILVGGNSEQSQNVAIVSGHFVRFPCVVEPLLRHGSAHPWELSRLFVFWSFCLRNSENVGCNERTHYFWLKLFL